MVSDNDGSAFITKAEFDSLKNNFQNQIDQYNTSIDSKIDGAIASYLAGIKVSKETTYSVETSDWEKVDMVNYALPQTWQPPNLNLTFNYDYSDNGGNSPMWYELWCASSGIKSNRASTSHQIRNCVSAGVESTSYTLPDNVVWLGQAKNYVDNIIGTKVGRMMARSTEAGVHNGYVTGATYLPAYFSVIYALDFGNGFLPSITDDNKWQAKLDWFTSQSSSHRTLGDDIVSTWYNRNVSSSISLEYVDGKQYQYEHIMTWDNNNWSQLSDPTWTNSLGDNPVWTKETTLASSGVSKNGFFSILEMRDNTRTDRTSDDWQQNTKEYDASNIGSVRYSLPTGSFHGYYSAGFGSESTENVKSVGVLNKTYTSGNIFQWSGKRKLKRDDTKEVENINLYNGLLIGYAKQEENFIWSPKITGFYKNGTTNVPIEKWRVKLSKKPFGVQDTLPSATDVLKNKDQTNDYLVTNTSGICKFDVEISGDTIIYCKWWPDDTTICNTKEWIGTIDLSSCGTYIISKND